MKVLKTYLPVSVALCCGSLLSAQFSADFTASEGYADGTLNANGAWTVPNPVVWTVADAAGSGVVEITPNGNFQRITYAGTGGTLSTNAYGSTNVFFLDYSADTAGANLTPDGNTLLTRFEFQGGGVTGTWLRQLVDGPGQFSLYVFSDLNEPKPQLGGIALEAVDLGLAHDGAVWTDAVSDPLEIVHTLVYDADAGQWVQSASVTNLATSTVLDTLYQAYAEDDDSFLTADNSYIINNGRLSTLPGLLFKVDSVAVATDAEVPDEPEPEPTTWAGYSVEADGTSVNTDTFLGWIDILNDPWIWSYSLDGYLYLPEENVSDVGGWAYAPK
jgi:hypothetical protein